VYWSLFDVLGSLLTHVSYHSAVVRLDLTYLSCGYTSLFQISLVSFDVNRSLFDVFRSLLTHVSYHSAVVRLDLTPASMGDHVVTGYIGYVCICVYMCVCVCVCV